MQINKNCTNCSLYLDAKHVCIGGRGANPASLLIVGQNPGYKEDRLGEPFVGESGTLLNKILRDIDSQITVRLTNAVKCYTPENRKPSLTEQEACRPYLITEILETRPEAILALGNEALTSLTGQGGITKKRGKPLELRASLRQAGLSAKVIATWHPAFILRDPSHRKEMEEDFSSVVRYIKSLRGEEQGETVQWKEPSRKDVLDLLENSALVGYDIETNGAPLTSSDLKVWMIGLSDGKTTLVSRHDLVWLTDTLAKYDHKIVGYNSISFDDVAIEKVFPTVGIRSGDAMYLDYLLDEGTSSYDGRQKGRHKLQSSVIRHLQIPPWKDEVTWNWSEFDPFSHELWPHAALYNGRDCSYTAQLYQKNFLKLTEKQKLLVTYLMQPAGRMLANMEKRGVPISLKNLQEVRLEVEVAKEKSLDFIIREAFKYDLWTFNPNSHPQVRDLLFGKMKLVPSKYTEAGEPSTDEESIKALILANPEQSPTLESILDYRGNTKLLSTYIEKCVPEEDGRVHTGYSITQTATGRTSSYGWSTQRTPRDKRLRRVVAAPPGYKLLSYDLSQVELRTMAFLSREPNMLAVYQDGKFGGDMHNYMASKIAEVMFKRDTWTPEDRQIAKPVDFACLYGAEAYTVQAYLLQQYGLRLTLQQVKILRDDVFFGEAFPKLPDYYNGVIKKAMIEGKVECTLGNIRSLPNIKARNPSLQAEAARAAINTDNQGLGSHLALIGCVIVEQNCKYIEQVAFNHDAGIALVKEDLARVAELDVKECFELGIPMYLRENFNIDFDVPIKLDVKVLDEWS